MKQALAGPAWRLFGRCGAALAVWLATLCFVLPAAAQGALLTIVEGEATLVDGLRRTGAAPGVRVGPGTLLETTAATTLVRLEWPDRTTVDLGPATKAMVQPPGPPPRGGKAPLLYLLQGWAKLSADAAPAGGLQTPAIDLLPAPGVAVVEVRKPQPGVFAETGAFELLERGAARRHALAQGTWFGGQVESRPPADWLGRVPRSFRDTLPHRADAFKGRSVTAPALPPPTYAMLADWLAAEPAIRRDFPRRFEALAQDPAFRRELQSRLQAHPEWARILYPPERRP